MKIMEGGVTAAKGFEAIAVVAGIKYQDRTDMALICSTGPCRTAGTFTTNLVKAAPVKWDQKIVADRTPVRAVVVNSGIANACTGQEGYDCCQAVADAAAKELGIDASGVLIGSTGVIGMQLPVEKMAVGLRKLAAEKERSRKAGTACREGDPDDGHL